MQCYKLDSLGTSTSPFSSPGPMARTLWAPTSVIGPTVNWNGLPVIVTSATYVGWRNKNCITDKIVSEKLAKHFSGYCSDILTHFSSVFPQKTATLIQGFDARLANRPLLVLTFWHCALNPERQSARKSKLKVVG